VIPLTGHFIPVDFGQTDQGRAVGEGKIEGQGGDGGQGKQTDQDEQA
jgi:hypothetical protein